MNATPDIDVAIQSVCLSVCQFCTRWYCVKTVEHIVDIISPPDSHIFLLFMELKIILGN